jgi:hypothetical protein
MPAGARLCQRHSAGTHRSNCRPLLGQSRVGTGIFPSRGHRGAARTTAADRRLRKPFIPALAGGGRKSSVPLIGTNDLRLGVIDAQDLIVDVRRRACRSARSLQHFEEQHIEPGGGLRDINSRRQGATAGSRHVADAQGACGQFPSAGSKPSAEQRWSLIAS